MLDEKELLTEKELLDEKELLRAAARRSLRTHLKKVTDLSRRYQVCGDET